MPTLSLMPASQSAPLSAPTPEQRIPARTSIEDGSWISLVRHLGGWKVEIHGGNAGSNLSTRSTGTSFKDLQAVFGYLEQELAVH